MASRYPYQTTYQLSVSESASSLLRLADVPQVLAEEAELEVLEAEVVA